MILSIDLTAPTVALLQAEAARVGRTVEVVAAERLAETVAADIDLDAVAGILEGLAGVDAGQARPLEEFQAEREAFWQVQK